MKKSAYSTYMQRHPLIIFEWHDDETDAVGWTVINALRNGAAGGGTRMNKSVTRDVVFGLAKVMEMKFTVSGPKIGGAKSGICFDQNDPRKHGVLERWYKAVLPLLRTRYGTGGDVNVALNSEVLPILWNYGLLHPQEGIVRGHHRRNDAITGELLNRMKTGITMPVTLFPDLYKAKGEHFAPTVGGMMTGYGVAYSAIWHYESQGLSIEGKRIAIEGFGEVGAHAAYFLQRKGAKVVAVHDAERWAVNEKGLDSLDLMKRRRGGRELPIEGTKARKSKLPPYLGDIDFDVYIPAALGELITSEMLEKLPAKLIVSGANDPFKGDPLGDTKVRDIADKKLTIIPDFIANCGTARLFGYLMDPKNPVMPSEQQICNDLEATISLPLSRLQKSHPKLTGWASAAYELAAKELEDARETGEYNYPS